MNLGSTRIGDAHLNVSPRQAKVITVLGAEAKRSAVSPVRAIEAVAVTRTEQRLLRGSIISNTDEFLLCKTFLQ